MELISEVRENISEVTAAEFFELVYESSFPKVARYIHNSGGSFDDAKDVFHDALLIFYEKFRKEELNLIKSETAYLLGISKHLWARKSTSLIHKSNLDYENLIDLPADPTPSEKKLLKFIEVAGKKCLDILYGFYYEHMSAKSIADSFGYSTEHSASVQKYKCIERIRAAIKQKSITYEDFFE